MAFSDAIKAVIQRSAVGVIGARAANYAQGVSTTRLPTAVGLARQLSRRYSETPGYTPQAMQQEAQRALRLQQAGASANRRTANAQERAALPIDPALSGSADRVRYEVLVTGRDQFGQTVVFRMEVTSTDAMNAREIQAYVQANAPHIQTFNRPRSPRVVVDDAEAPLEVTVLTAGRRG